ncbi:MAG: hypothetical protein JW779_14380 [Candidatus Thorarchaeota archaeon]|nr:hypothetical protein [Candidatus Thorarchaeota archaeon]
MVLFGSSAELIIDINLIAQYLVLFLLILGFIKRKPFKTHGYLMLVMTIISVGTTLLIMGPSLILNFSTHPPTILVHSIVGLIAILIGALFNFKFFKAMKEKQPLMCGSKNFMRIAFVIWLIPILGGTFFYISTYFVV